MKTLERVILKYLLRIIYVFSCIFPVKKRIVFATYRNDTMNGNFKYIHDEIMRRDTGYKCKFLYEKYSGGLSGTIKYFLHMMKATFYMATSEYFLIDDFYFPVYTVNKLRKGTEVVQVWHACGAFKKFGFSILDKNFGADNNYVKYIPIHSNYSHVLVSSKEVAKYYAEAFNMSEYNIDPIGIPRTDIFFNEEMQDSAKEKVYNKYPEIRGKKIVLYAPTFRGNSQSDAKAALSFDIDKVVDTLPDDYILALKMHPFVKDGIKTNNKRVVDLSDYPAINDILVITDLLITDYSSIVFEYSLLERPMIFYADDLNSYEHERDFYYPYESFVPGPITTNTEELVEVLNNSNCDYEKIKDFKNKFFDDVDGLASKRFVDRIILKKDN
ncbi:MAG: CDP-glycerol glycerophosphotransferase family protein [Clostridium baratii]|uniref:CDP-glycerol glycerophosphotransferase family protein n=1 Tax=Clostridium baratii TaxID=1561 RepID=UPI0024330918|nr:CDP-glycerol glycerophosphotransferase family protein [Clostridium baratii]MBS6041254.1 CDP-glycerol glycerophosphotransferase family protein [Clostridium baratii]